MGGKAFDSNFLVSFFFLQLGLALFSESLPLSTKRRWIIDAKSGDCVKLACVNWASHLQPMLAEGLDKQPLNYITSQVTKRQFNCVRFTWATYMFTRPGYSKLTVAQSFDALNLTEAKAGIARHNYFLLNLTIVEAYEAVVDELGAHGVMVLLDNHISQPQWWCPQYDGNGFFGDAHFHPKEWLRGLVIVAKLFKGKSQVVAMSMRNELLGPLQNEKTWHIGTHLVESGDPKGWEVQPLNRICAQKTQDQVNLTGFVTAGESPVPLFLDEVGIDQRGVNRANNQFFTSFLAYVVDKDLDWGLWALQESYYYKNGVTGLEEKYGLFNAQWDNIRRPKFNRRLFLITTIIQDPSSNVSISNLIYHPKSGSCIYANRKNEVYTGNCRRRSLWSHDKDGGRIRLMGSDLCLKAVSDEVAPLLSTDCLGQQSSWNLLSKSKLQLGIKDENGDYLCLHKESFKILTRKCICVE